MNDPSKPRRDRAAGVVMLLAAFFAALFLRVGAAIWLEHRVRARGAEHDFADSELYWKLGLQIAQGSPYSDGRRQVLRTPGYPLFLAGVVRVLGPTTIGARHTQAAVGAAACVLAFFLVRRVLHERAAWVAAWLAVLYPFAIFLSAVLLSEVLFTAVLLVQVIGLAHLLDGPPGRGIARRAALAALVGVAGAVGTLVRPSWILATPLAATWIALRSGRRGQASADERAADDAGSTLFERLRGVVSTGAMLTAFVVCMGPWWLRNYRVTGHVVLTTLWVGPSLYDGLNPRATGASDMGFMDRPADWGLDPALPRMSEWEQDQYLRGKSLDFTAAQPWRVVELAAIKFVRFWNPLPNAAEWQNWTVRLLSLASAAPVLLLAVVGAWRLRRQPGGPRALLLLAGPVLYFCVIHLIFVSSIRYREAATLPLLGLAAAAVTGPGRIGAPVVGPPNR